LERIEGAQNPQGVGLLFIEELSLGWVILFGCSIFVCGLAIGIAWYTKTGDISGGFTVASFVVGGLTILAIAVTAVQNMKSR
jgi:hypothetical protein